MDPKVLFISHSAARSGAPLVLLHFLNWMKEHSNIGLEILVKSMGSLFTDYSHLGQTKLYEFPIPKEHKYYKIIQISGLHKFWEIYNIRQLISHYKHSNINLIYSNTITNGDLLYHLSELDCPIICHVHELNYWIERMGRDNIERVKQYTNRYVAVSNSVKWNLVENYEIPTEIIDVVYEFIPIKPLSIDNQKIRQFLKIPEKALIIGGSGIETWRKGKDLFVNLANLVIKRCIEQSIHFVWVGPFGNEEEKFQLKYDLLKAGIDDKVHFTGEVSNPEDFFSTFDIFVLMSREDPFPLVSLEAASHGKPIICFDKSGGTPEFIESSMGFVVPYLDLYAMAEKIIYLAKNREIRIEMGNRAAEKVRRGNDVSVQAPKILEIIDRVMN